ncbi:CAP family protein [Sinosporangium siamense]|nr:CAP family protein [Sinosporangium siamense]
MGTTPPVSASTQTQARAPQPLLREAVASRPESAVATPAESASRLLAADAFQQDCLKAHNTYRARHGVPAMRTEPAGLEAAKKSATYYAQKGSIDHSSPYKHARGENLFVFMTTNSDTVASCADAVRAWYQGISHYDFNRPGFSFDTGWFTQVVWKSSTQLGCAQAIGQTSGRSGTYIVCLYNPPGNLLGNDGAHFRDNVPRLIR